MIDQRTAWPAPVEGVPLRRAVVDAGALTGNAAALAAAVRPAQVMAIVKGNGYGHGAVLAARCALDGGAARLGVSSAEEALQLRRAGIDAPLLVTGWTHPSTLPALLDAGVELSITGERSLDAVSAAAADHGGASVHLKVDTGMHRQGVGLDEVPNLLRLVAGQPDRVRLAGVFTHLADADGPQEAFSELQNDRFLPVAAMARDVEPGVLVHVANSAAALRFAHMRHDCVRTGIALYGVRPPQAPDTVPLRPALSFRALVTGVRDLDAGETVGYGRTWSAARRSRVAVIAAGYADGVQRAQGNRGAVLVNGRRCPIVGRVSMDQLSADVTDAGEVSAGDEVVLIGSGDDGGTLTADEVAEAGGTIAYEVLTQISARVPRVVVGPE